MTKRGRSLLLVFAVLAAVLIAVWRARTSLRGVAPVASSAGADVRTPALLEVASGPGEAPVAGRAAVGELEPRADELTTSPGATDQGLDVTWPSHGDAAFVVGVTSHYFDARVAAKDLVAHGSEPDGVVRIRGLAPRTVHSIAPIVDGRPLLTFSHQVVVEPGEVRSVVLAASHELRGILIDSEGTPIDRCLVWLAHDDESGRWYFQPCRSVVAQTETDDAGRFVFRDLEAGAWVVGPGLRSAPAGDCDPIEPPSACASPIQTPLFVGDQDVEIVLRVWRGLFLNGTTFDASGKPCEYCHVTATSVDSGRVVTAETDEDGNFAVGPLEGGRFRVDLYGNAQGIRGKAATVEAWSGDDGVTLRLDPGLSLTVACELPASAAHRLTSVLVSRIDPGTGEPRIVRHVTVSRVRGAETIHTLEAGEYVFAAFNGESSFGTLSGVRVVAGEPEPRVTITLAPAGPHDVLVRGTAVNVHVRLTQRGCALIDNDERVGVPRRYIAFAEPVRIELRENGDDVRPLFSGTFEPGTLREPLVIDLDR